MVQVVQVLLGKQAILLVLVVQVMKLAQMVGGEFGAAFSGG